MRLVKRGYTDQKVPVLNKSKSPGTMETLATTYIKQDFEAMKAGKSAIRPWLSCQYNENTLVDLRHPCLGYNFLYVCMQFLLLSEDLMCTLIFLVLFFLWAIYTLAFLMIFLSFVQRIEISTDRWKILIVPFLECQSWIKFNWFDQIYYCLNIPPK